MAHDNNEPFPTKVIQGSVQIPAPVDKRYKQMLLNEAWKLGNADVYAKIKTAVEKTPSPNAYAESYAHFGESIFGLCRVTAGLVDELEHHHPGMQRWLEISGHGNDKNMIEALVAWVTLMHPPATIA